MEPFTYPVAGRLAGATDSPLKSIFDLMADPRLISFAGGVPDPGLFAAEEIAEAYAWAFATHPDRALQYGTTEGEPELREQAARRLTEHNGLPTRPDQIQITSGSQEGIAALAQLLLEPGDVVLVEQPTYLAAVQAFQLSGARMIGVPTDDEGVQPDALADLIARHAPKFVYLIPTFQNPTGRTMGAARRAAVADVLARAGTALVEDDPYADLRFDGEPLAPIASLAGMSRQTLLLNSLSKTMAPGLRLGWVRGEGDVMASLSVVKAALTMQSGVVDQLAVARYLATADLNAHVRDVAAVYRERRDVLLAGLVGPRRAAEAVPGVSITATGEDGILPAGAHVTYPTGGMFLWVALGGARDAQQLLPRAVEEGVAWLPGWSFYAQDPDVTTMRLSFVTHAPEVLAEGIARMGRALG